MIISTKDSITESDLAQIQSYNTIYICIRLQENRSENVGMVSSAYETISISEWEDLIMSLLIKEMAYHP